MIAPGTFKANCCHTVVLGELDPAVSAGAHSSLVMLKTLLLRGGAGTQKCGTVCVGFQIKWTRRVWSFWIECKPDFSEDAKYLLFECLKCSCSSWELVSCPPVALGQCRNMQPLTSNSRYFKPWSRRTLWNKTHMKNLDGINAETLTAIRSRWGKNWQLDSDLFPKHLSWVFQN